MAELTFLPRYKQQIIFHISPRWCVKHASALDWEVSPRRRSLSRCTGSLLAEWSPCCYVPPGLIYSQQGWEEPWAQDFKHIPSMHDSNCKATIKNVLLQNGESRRSVSVHRSQRSLTPAVLVCVLSDEGNPVADHLGKNKWLNMKMQTCTAASKDRIVSIQERQLTFSMEFLLLTE